MSVFRGPSRERARFYFSCTLMTVPINIGKFVVLSIMANTNGLSRFTTLGS